MKYFLVIIFILTGFFLQAQQNRFVFFQAPQGKPFYVRLGADNYSSSAFGHLVIPRLKDSTYHFYIGFPRNEIPEKEFVIDLKGKDRGYDIRTENQAEVTLFEWQTGNVIRHSGKEDPAMMAMKGKKRSDPYALLMAGVVNDPLVLYMQEPVKEEVANNTVGTKSEDVTRVAAPDSSELVVNLQDNAPGIESKPADTAMVTRIDSVASRIDVADNRDVAVKKNIEPSEDSLAIDRRELNKEEAGIVSKGQDAKDTALVAVAAETEKKDTGVAAAAAREKKDTGVAAMEGTMSSGSPEGTTKESTTVIANQVKPVKEDSGNKTQMSSASVEVIRLFEETVAEGKRMLYVDHSGSTKDSIDILIEKEMPVSDPVVTAQEEKKADKEDEEGSSIVLYNSNCTRSATEQDIDRLRVQMLKQKSDDDRVFSARKLLKSRCMTTAQVRALSELFPSEEGRYMFFDAAYPFVSDSGNFKELINLLTDPYYINRFKAMVRM